LCVRFNGFYLIFDILIRLSSQFFYKYVVNMSNDGILAQLDSQVEEVASW
jgi:hypothetical protein